MLRYRVVQVLWVMVSAGWLVLLSRGLGWGPETWLVVLGAILFADIGSYIFHYLIDHYGSPDAGGLVLEFQFHHLVPRGIAEKSVSEVLDPTLRIITPFLAGLLLPAWEGWLSPGAELTLFVVLNCWALGQMCHRWAHMRAGPWVRALQRMHLLLSPQEHDDHHRQPFDRRFAVITGWSNVPLDRLGAPHLLDALMHAMGFQKRGLINSLQDISARGGKFEKV